MLPNTRERPSLVRELLGERVRLVDRQVSVDGAHRLAYLRHQSARVA
jgi:hypothetical protein